MFSVTFDGLGPSDALVLQSDLTSPDSPQISLLQTNLDPTLGDPPDDARGWSFPVQGELILAAQPLRCVSGRRVRDARTASGIGKRMRVPEE